MAFVLSAFASTDGVEMEDLPEDGEGGLTGFGRAAGQLGMGFGFAMDWLAVWVGHFGVVGYWLCPRGQSHGLSIA